MPKFEDTLPKLTFPDRAAFRAWLAENHAISSGIWIIFNKASSDKGGLRYPEAVQEVLCFGWIDSKAKSIDAERFQQIFTPRRPKSVWSKLNKTYIEQLIAAGLMTPAGLVKISAAQQDGSWTALDAAEALEIPDDLRQALEADPTAEQTYQNLNNSAKRAILYWLSSAKRPETRQKRFEQALQALTQGKNPLAPLT